MALLGDSNPFLVGVIAKDMHVATSVGGDDLPLPVKDDEGWDAADIELFLEQFCQFRVKGDGRPPHLCFLHILIHVLLAAVAADEDDFEGEVVLMAVIAELDQFWREGAAGGHQWAEKYRPMSCMP